MEFVCLFLCARGSGQDGQKFKEGLACSYNKKKEVWGEKKKHRNYFWDYQKLNIEAVMMLHCHSVLFAKKCPPGTV